MSVDVAAPAVTFWRRLFDGERGFVCVAGLDRRPPEARPDPRKTLHEAYYA